jgi:hypothetical protein
MDRTAGGALRWTRALLLAAVAMGSGVVAHLSAAGRLPGPAMLVLLFLLCASVAAAFLGRPASTLRVVVLTVGGQTFVHGFLTALSGHRGDPPLRRVVTTAPPAAVPPPTGQTRSGSYFDLVYAPAHQGSGTQLALPAPVQHLMADLTGAHAVMGLAHLAAAVLVGLWLAVGERALWHLVVLAADSARRVVTAACSAYALVRCGARALLAPLPLLDDGPPLRLRQLLDPIVVRRGPPLLPAA